MFVLQYLFDVTKDEDEVLISLQQRDMKIHRQIGQGENLYVGFSVLKVGQTSSCLHVNLGVGTLLLYVITKCNGKERTTKDLGMAVHQYRQLK